MRKKQINLILTGIIVIILYACESNDFSFSAGTGTGGSLARFTVVGDYLFTVDYNGLNVFDISSNEDPVHVQSKYVDNEVETIFPLSDKLFIGTRRGMYIYNISMEGEPYQISYYEHVISCDPVVSDGAYAYVTLSSNRNNCWRDVNELHIIDLEDIGNPKLVKAYEMENPRGLAIQNDTLWVCDNSLKVLDVSDKTNVKELYNFTNLHAEDIIVRNKMALAIGNTGLVQYKLENDTIRQLSRIRVEYKH